MKLLPNVPTRPGVHERVQTGLQLRRLIDRFGGLTAYARSPAEGIWDNGEKPVSDQIVIFEVMVDALDREWWASYRSNLEGLFRQDEILIRASQVDRL